MQPVGIGLKISNQYFIIYITELKLVAVLIEGGGHSISL